MPEITPIPIADLLLDSGNPRLADESTSQQQAAQALAEQQGDKVIRLAEDIVKHGIDPMALTGVVATGDRRKRYKVLEGNRRVLALRALETPMLVSPVLSPSNEKKLTELAGRFAQAPIAEVPCVLFSSEDEALHWIALRHTGENQGVGLVDWDSTEKDRFNDRHAGVRRPSGQVLDFVEKAGNLTPAAKASARKISTSIDRLLTSPDVRQKLGVDLVRGEVLAHYPQEEVAKSLTRVVEDLKTGKVTVPDLYHVGDRRKYVNDLPRTALPKKSAMLGEPVVLSDLAAGRRTPRKRARRKQRKSAAPPRTTVIPKSSNLDIDPSRINRIYNELLDLSAERYPNACSVLLRVFVELSTDHYIEQRKLMTDAEARGAPLAKRLKAVAADLKKRGKISLKLEQAVKKIADGSTVMQPKLPTFHQYVHNQYVFPSAQELFGAWDELSPFIDKVWA